MGMKDIIDEQMKLNWRPASTYVHVPPPAPLPEDPPEIEYKYREDELIKEFVAYVNDTYGEHYSQNKFQSTEFIIDAGHGEGFCIGNAIKYLQRYGKKQGRNRKDLMKAMHYVLFSLYVHDTMMDETPTNKD